MVVKFSCFQGPWETEVFGEAAERATEVGRERLISISESSEHDQQTVTVWYWADDDEPGPTGTWRTTVPKP